MGFSGQFVPTSPQQGYLNGASVPQPSIAEALEQTLEVQASTCTPETKPVYDYPCKDEQRLTGITAGTAGNFTILTIKQNTIVLSVTVQPQGGATSVQLFENTTPMSGKFNLTDGQIGVLAGKKLNSDLVLAVGSAVAVSWEIRYLVEV